MPSTSRLQQQYGINDEQVGSVAFLVSLIDDSQVPAGMVDPDAIITTHCAHIVLTHNRAYKIKRAVKYSYLDMLELNVRERLCKRELEINKPGLPNTYLDVLPITKGDDAKLSLDGDGDIVEWVLVMKRFSVHRVLDNMAKNGTLSVEIAKQVGKCIARYHESLPCVKTSDGYDRMNEIVVELIDELSAPQHHFSHKLLEQFATQGKAVVDAQSDLLNSRAENGYIKRCHGDLHLRNLVLMEDGPHPFDALEFDERLATIDVLYDLAFVLMDLSHRNLLEHENNLLNQYVVRCEPVDLEGLALLPLFLFCRAGVRAMTTAQSTIQQSTLQQLKPNQEALQYFNLALSYLAPASPALITIGGYSGSGKSTIASQIAVNLNAIMLSSDVERKAQLHVSETQQLPATSYTTKSSRLNYQRLRDKARFALLASQTVVVDATFLSKEQRVNIE